MIINILYIPNLWFFPFSTFKIILIAYFLFKEGFELSASPVLYPVNISVYFYLNINKGLFVAFFKYISGQSENVSCSIKLYYTAYNMYKLRGTWEWIITCKNDVYCMSVWICVHVNVLHVFAAILKLHHYTHLHRFSGYTDQCLICSRESNHSKKVKAINFHKSG